MVCATTILVISGGFGSLGKIQNQCVGSPSQHAIEKLPLSNSFLMNWRAVLVFLRIKEIMLVLCCCIVSVICSPLPPETPCRALLEWYFTQEDLEGITDFLLVLLTTYLCVVFFCSSYLGKTRTDLKVFLP